jgi:hypothetical protein
VAAGEVGVVDVVGDGRTVGEGFAYRVVGRVGRKIVVADIA